MKGALAKYIRSEWLGEKPTKNSRWTFNIVYLAKSDYIEVNKVVKASWSELLYILKNELAIHNKLYAKVLWRIQKLPEHKFRLQFACVNTDKLADYTGQLVLLYPESWAVQQCLQNEQLYLVVSATHYWAYRTADGTVHFTDKKGLMRQPEYFLSAIGVVDGQASSAYQTLAIKQVVADKTLLPRWYDWAGMLYQKAKPRDLSLATWKPYLAFGTAAVLLYTIVLSGALALYSDHLKSQVALQQQDAEVLLQQRQSTERLLSQVNTYAPLVTASANYSALLAFLAQQLPEGTELRRTQFSENMAQIQGVAPSATEVMAQLNKSEQAREVKFDRPVQAERQAESFTISFMFSPAEVQDAGH